MSASQDIITTPSTQSRKRSIADWLTPPRSKHENSENSDVEIISETFNPRSPKAKKRKEDIPVIRVLKPIVRVTFALYIFFITFYRKILHRLRNLQLKNRLNKLVICLIYVSLNFHFFSQSSDSVLLNPLL